MKKIVTINTDYLSSFDKLVNFLDIKDENILSELEWDEENPDIVFVTDKFYIDRECYKKFLKYYSTGNNRVFIFITGEAVAPDFNIFDYAIVYNWELKDTERVFRIPPFYRYVGKTLKNSYSKDNQKRNFCNFIYSNSSANPFRDKLFYKIFEYKKVDSLGKHLNNVGMPTTRHFNNWQELSVEMKSRYKFSIACENELYPGYTTEKLLTSFDAHTIPIYWGNPVVGKEFNEKAFINCHSYNNLDEVIDRIKEIDENDEIFNEILSEPWQTDEQIEMAEREMLRTKEAMKYILTHNLNEVQKRPIGGNWSVLYFDGFMRKTMGKKEIFIEKVKQKIKKIFKFLGIDVVKIKRKIQGR